VAPAVNDPMRVQQMVRRQVRRRRRWQRVRLALLVLAATAVVVAAAVGIDRLAVVVHKFYAEHHHHTGPRTTAVTNRTTSTTTTTVAGPPRCQSTQLSAVVSDWRDTGGTVEEVVALTNLSLTPCTVAGYPVLGVVASTGTALPATNSDVASIGSADTVGTTAPVPTTAPVGTTVPSAPLTVAHGALASFEFAYSDDCDHVLPPGQAATGAPNECYGGLWLAVTPTPGSSPLIVTLPLHLTYATSGLQVGPFRAGGGPPLAGQPPLTTQTTVSTVAPPTP
jgi:hypothetical protein